MPEKHNLGEYYHRLLGIITRSVLNSLLVLMKSNTFDRGQLFAPTIFNDANPYGAMTQRKRGSFYSLVHH